MENNSTNEPDLRFDLTGRKEISDFELSENDIDFYLTGQFKEDVKTITVNNTGTVDLSWNDPVQSDNFVIENISPNPTPAGETSTADVRFKGAENGKYEWWHEFTDTCGNVRTLHVVANVDEQAPISVMLDIGDVSGEPGDIIDLPVYLRDADGISLTGITGLKCKLTMNSTLLLAFEKEDYNIENYKTTLNLTLPAEPDSTELLTNIRCLVGLGNSQRCDLVLSEIEPIGGSIEIQKDDGVFTLIGLCEEGGTRLLRPGDPIKIDVNPNPAGKILNISYNLIEKGKTDVYIINEAGRKVQTILTEFISKPVDKEHSISTENISSGVYFIVVQTPSMQKTVKFAVEK